jgi:hypothetical protein
MVAYLKSLLQLAVSDKVTQYRHFLFIFCVEGFSAILKEAQLENELRGVRLGASGPHVTHLLFGDDSVGILKFSWPIHA